MDSAAIVTSFKQREAFNETKFHAWLDQGGFEEFWGRLGGLPDVAGKDVFDFGCGRGAMAQRLMEAGARSVRGIDLNPVTVNFAERKVASQWGSRVEFICGDIRHFVSARAGIPKADIVVSSDTMEHVMDLPDTLRAVVEVCKPGGDIYIGFSPLWHSPFGHHKLIASKVPWIHLGRGNQAFLDRLRKERGTAPDTIQQRGFNGATPADFRAALAGLPVEIVSARRNCATSPLKRAAMQALGCASIVPALEKYVTIGLYWHLHVPLSPKQSNGQSKTRSTGTSHPAIATRH